MRFCHRWHGDTSRMYCPGNPSVKAKNLINNTYESMMKGIDSVKPGLKLGDLGFIIQENAEKNNFEVRDLGAFNTDSVDYPDYGKVLGDFIISNNNAQTEKYPRILFGAYTFVK